MTFDPFSRSTRQSIEGLAAQLKNGWFDLHGAWHRGAMPVGANGSAIERTDVLDRGGFYTVQMLLTDERQFTSQPFPKAEE